MCGRLIGAHLSKSVVVGLAAMLMLFGSLRTSSEQQLDPSPQTIANELRAQIVHALEVRDYATVLEGCETYHKLESEGIKMPDGLIFAEAEAAKERGDWLRARAALSLFLERADRTDPLHLEAVKMYPLVEAEVARQSEEQGARLLAEKEAEERAKAEELAAAALAAQRKRVIVDLPNDMMVIPAGKFRMGDIDRVGSDTERPVHAVQVTSFLIGKHEVTFEQFDAYCAAVGRQPPDDNGWGRDKRPVINVNHEDVSQFVTWLSQQTGLRFRLPTEAEWEYAARGGTETNYWWGEDFKADNANTAGTGGRDRWGKTAPVGEFPPNQFGLYDMNGNVREWVQDCWVSDYSEKRRDAGAATTGDCSRRVLRGGSWNLSPEYQRSSSRDSDDQTYRYVDRGFRVARDP